MSKTNRPPLSLSRLLKYMEGKVHRIGSAFKLHQLDLCQGLTDAVTHKANLEPDAHHIAVLCRMTRLQ